VLAAQPVQLAEAGPVVVAEALADLGPLQELPAVARLFEGPHDLEDASLQPAQREGAQHPRGGAQAVAGAQPGLEALEVSAHGRGLAGRHLALDRADDAGEGLRLADPRARELAEGQVEADEVADAGIASALERQILAREPDRPLRGRGPEGLEVVGGGGGGGLRPPGGRGTGRGTEIRPGVPA